MIRNLAPVFPTEPVGVGARWEVSEGTGMIGVRLTHTTTYEVESIEGDAVQLKIYIAQTAAEQEMSVMGGQFQARLLSLYATGRTRTTADLGSLYPREDTHQWQMQMELESKDSVPEGSPGAGRQSIELAMRIETRRSP
jgi:hypothetical protein